MSLRDSPFSDVKVPLAWTAALALVVMLVAGVALLVSDRRETFETQAYGAAKSTVDVGAAKVSGLLSAPVRWTESGIGGVKGYFFAVSENRRLKAENLELRRWRDAALALQDNNERLRTILQLKTDPPVPMVTGQAVSDSRGPFSNSRLINVGSERGVQSGNPVMSENGLVGRVVGVTAGASRVLMVTDIASKVPVMIDRTNARAIMTGDGGPNPKLAYLRGLNPVKAGDRIVTSGDGGVYPRGLPVGVATKGIDGAWRVQLASDYAPIDFVRVLKYQDFTQLVDQKALGHIELPPAPPDILLPDQLVAHPAALDKAHAEASGRTVIAPAAPPNPPPAANAVNGPAPANRAVNAPAPAARAVNGPAPVAKTGPALNAPAPKAAAPAAKAGTPAPKAAAPAAKTVAPTTPPKPPTAQPKAATPQPKAAAPQPKAPSTNAPPVQRPPPATVDESVIPISNRAAPARAADPLAPLLKAAPPPAPKTQTAPAAGTARPTQ